MVVEPLSRAHRSRDNRELSIAPRALPLLFVVLLAVQLLPLMHAAPSGAEPDRDGRATTSTISAEARAQRWQAFRHSRQGAGAEIVGGVPVPQGVYPFVTQLVIDFEDSFIACGASLIAPSFVLTTAHCVDDNKGNPYEIERFILAIGQVDLTKVEDANLFGVTSLAIHPSWNPRKGGPDVAVLTLDEAVPASIAQPVTLIGSGDTTYEQIGQPTVVVGWGRTSGNGDHSNQLLAGQQSVIKNKPCKRAFPSFKGSQYMCTRQADVSSCNGDSGGPLLIQGTGGEVSQLSGGADQQRRDVFGERNSKKKHKKSPPPPLPPPPTTTLQIGVISLGREGCPREFQEAPVQLSAPEIRDFITSVVGT